ncbi:hypothetical protein Ciccas_007384 [Cichlidogyrus casuarinus]|uniref:Endoplasmic reticulum vesicle transporter C-terminal domain-containing protein n=1 Tax=Cichlidogyrus casuarinus TaxID=1844966 RepID=A0ABD2Q313_9PLAT
MHVHMSFFGSDAATNYSHRIHHFSIGPSLRNQVHVLQGEEKISHSNNPSFKYFIQAVATEFTEGPTFHGKTYHYSATELSSGEVTANDIAGIFFTYTFFPLKIRIDSSSSDTLGFLIIRLCSSIGGIFATVHVLRNLALALLHLYKEHFSRKSAQKHAYNIISPPVE